MKPLAIHLVLLSLSLGSQSLACPTPPDMPGLQSSLIRDINAERAAKGMAALTANAALTRAAQSLACDNAARKVVGHTGADGATLTTRMARVGYRFSNAAENAAGGYADPASVTDGWMHSSGHRKNILTTPLQDIGVGVAKGPDGLLYWIIDMGVQR